MVRIRVQEEIINVINDIMDSDEGNRIIYRYDIRHTVICMMWKHHLNLQPSQSVPKVLGYDKTNQLKCVWMCVSTGGRIHNQSGRVQCCTTFVGDRHYLVLLSD